MNLFYHASAQMNATIIFDSAEATHLVKVLRKQSGDIIDLTDGQGNHFRAALDIGKKETKAIVLEGRFIQPRSEFLEIAIAPTKNNERLEWFVEKAVEIGVEKITLLHCEHSERPHLKLDRLHKIAVSAMKQSLKFYLPVISEMTSFRQWLSETSATQKCIAHCEADLPRVFLKNAIEGKSNVCIAIGPEGDFSKAEIEAAISTGFVPASLGSSRLRTETAALAAVHTFELIHQV
jgi:16S rRNA (uracil1498-N3)-methyltransferase